MDPVVCEDGHTYERDALERWLQKKLLSPKTGAALRTRVVMPNITLRNVIADEMEKLPPAERAEYEGRKFVVFCGRIQQPSVAELQLVLSQMAMHTGQAAQEAALRVLATDWGRYSDASCAAAHSAVERFPALLDSVYAR